MSPASEPNPNAEQWLQHAESDIRLARLAQNHSDILRSQVCFHINWVL